MQGEASDARGHPPDASPPASMRTPTPRLRFIFLALVALSVVSLLAVSSRVGVSLSPPSRFKALQAVETADHEAHEQGGSDRTADKATEALHVVEDPGIPRVIHQSWKNVYQIPTRFHPWMKSWRDLHPTWTYVFWTDEDNLRLFQQLYPRYLHVAKAVKKVNLADMARYALLHHVGGLYVDADFECLQPFDDLHRGRSVFLSSEPLVHAVLLEKSRSAALCNALMASAPGHPFWLQVLDNIKEKFDRERLRSDAVELTGPRMVKQTYESLNSSSSSDIEVFPSEYFYPEVAYWNKEPMEQACRRRHDDAAREACDWLSRFPRGEFTNNTHATHHWQCTWCRDAQLDEFGPLRDVFESPPTGPNILALRLSL